MREKRQLRVGSKQLPKTGRTKHEQSGRYEPQVRGFCGFKFLYPDPYPWLNPAQNPYPWYSLIIYGTCCCPACSLEQDRVRGGGSLFFPCLLLYSKLLALLSLVSVPLLPYSCVHQPGHWADTRGCRRWQWEWRCMCRAAGSDDVAVWQDEAAAEDVANNNLKVGDTNGCTSSMWEHNLEWKVSHGSQSVSSTKEMISWHLWCTAVNGWL